MRAGGGKTDDAIRIAGDEIRAWLSDPSSVCIERPRVGDTPPPAKLTVRVDVALATPAFLLLAPCDCGGGKRLRPLCDQLAELLARPLAPPPKRGRGATANDAATAAAAAAAAAAGLEDEVYGGGGGYEEEDEDVEAFRQRASPSGSADAVEAGAPAGAFRRQSGLSGGGGGGPLAAALLAEPTPGSDGARRSKGSRGSGGTQRRRCALLQYPH